MLHGFLDIALPFAGLRLAVHPYADRQQYESGKKRSEPLYEFTTCSTYADQVSRCHPSQATGDKGRQPSAMDEGQNFRSLGLAQERDHRDHDQQCLEPFAQQDRKGSCECRRLTGIVRGEDRLGAVEKNVERIHPLGDGGQRIPATYCRSKLRHAGFDRCEQVCIARA